MLLAGSSAALAGAFVEPAAFASSNGLLDLLMIAQPQPVPSIVYVPPDSPVPINPTGWVYQICPMSAALAGNQCPSGSATVSDYSGVRLALQPGDTLQIRLVNRLPVLDPVKVNHSQDPGGANLPLNLTNLHTHGMLVEARAPTLSDPTFGDYVFMEIYNSANGTPVPQLTHQHGSIVKDYADYSIVIPANHPSGAFWFHPHIHGLSLNQLSSGLSGIITVGSVGDYASIGAAPFPDSGVRHLILKDMQVLAASQAQPFFNGNAPVVDGEVLNQEASPFCNQYPLGEPPRLGYCLGQGPVIGDSPIHPANQPKPQTNLPKPETWGVTGYNYYGGDWYFTVSGQVYPTLNITEANGEVWSFTNASGSVTYDLELINNTTQTPMIMQLVAVDGISIDVPPSTPMGTVVRLGGTRFTVVACPPSSVTSSVLPTPVCVSEFAMMPSSRVELYVIYRDQNGNIVTPPSGASATLQQIGITTGAVGDLWPQINLANVLFTQTDGPAGVAGSALAVHGQARTANEAGGIFKAPVPYAVAAAAPAGCKPLAAGHHRRIFFGFPDTTDPDIFGLGYEEVDQNGAVIPDTEIPVTAFDPTANTLCIPLGPGQTPVTETWELVNLATENHNFHIHQTRFSYLDPADQASIVEDNVPLPVATANTSDVSNYQNGYCTIAQWRDGDCTSQPVIIQNTFSQLGQFVYHCHILAHEDGGMMAAIEVVPSPSPRPTNTHDFNGDGFSDIAWANSDGDVSFWLMNGTTILQPSDFVNVPPSAGWSIVGQRDFNGDGDADLLWHNANGDTSIWLMNATTISTIADLGIIPTAWTVAGTGDFNGDGKGDILWRNTSTGEVAIWLMDGVAVSQTLDLGTVPLVWTIAGVGDFNGDGNSDILWRNTATGDVTIWLLNGTAVSGASDFANVPLASNWTIAGTGDFNGDGDADILWRNTATGDVAIWLMNGTAISQATDFANVALASGWTIAETGDFNGDGYTDILWSNISTGDVAIWLMNGSSISAATDFANVPVASGWTIQSLNAD